MLIYDAKTDVRVQILPSNRPNGDVPLDRIASFFHGWIDYDVVAFLMKLLEWSRTDFQDFRDEKNLVGRDYKMETFVVKVVRESD